MSLRSLNCTYPDQNPALYHDLNSIPSCIPSPNCFSTRPSLTCTAPNFMRSGCESPAPPCFPIPYCAFSMTASEVHSALPLNACWISSFAYSLQRDPPCCIFQGCWCLSNSKNWLLKAGFLLRWVNLAHSHCSSMKVYLILGWES